LTPDPAPLIRRHAYLASLVASLAAFAGIVAPAQSDDPVATEVLPNLRQEVPSQVRIALVNGTWRLGFASEVSNDGPGYLKVTGNGPGDAPMVADQIVQMSDGTSETRPAIGEMHYVIGGGHEHWHLLDFERYELRAASDPATPILRDQKTGFCLADAFTSDQCGLNHPELTTVSEGISVGGSDVYLGYLEGQYIPIDPATVPDGDYLLVNRVNVTGALLDGSTSDDAASVRINVKWSGGTPSMTVTNSCPASIDCPAPPGEPLPDPQPQPQSDPQPITSAPEPVLPTPEPQPVPVVPPSEFAPAAAKASMSRSMAGRLVRRAIQKSLDQAPRALRSSCSRRSADSFGCNSSWRGASATRWSGRVRVWYRVRNNRLAWFYDLTARRTPDGKRVVTRAAQGSASRAVFSSATGALYCARLNQRP
jgi:Lysyl oxidase